MCREMKNIIMIFFSILIIGMMFVTIFLSYKSVSIYKFNNNRKIVQKLDETTNNDSSLNISNLKNISISYYITIGIESFILSLLVVYLLITKFNKIPISGMPNILLSLFLIFFMTYSLLFLNVFTLNKLCSNTNSIVEKISINNK